MATISHITFVSPVSIPDKISAIKAIRSLTGIGLKEAKDASERSGEQTFPVQNFSGYANPDREIENQMRILRTLGFQVGGSFHLILQSLRELATQALQQGEDELANEILQLVLAEKLRRQP